MDAPAYRLIGPYISRMAKLQLSHEIRPTPVALNLLLKSDDVTISSYDIIAQFRHCSLVIWTVFRRKSSTAGNFCGRLQTEQKTAWKTTSKICRRI